MSLFLFSMLKDSFKRDCLFNTRYNVSFLENLIWIIMYKYQVYKYTKFVYMIHDSVHYCS